jgi:homoserine dehydrogenase
MERKLDTLSQHVIVAGYGEVGARVADQHRQRGEAAKTMLIEITTPSESDRKLSMTLMARAISPTLYISVLATVPGGGKWFKHAGASEVLYVDSLIADAVVESFARTCPHPGAALGSPAS